MENYHCIEENNIVYNPLISNTLRLTSSKLEKILKKLLEIIGIKYLFVNINSLDNQNKLYNDKLYNDNNIICKIYNKNTTNIEDVITNLVDQDNVFNIVNLRELIDIYIKWSQLLPNIKPYYAIKCNPNIVMLKLLALLGSNFDCASKNEIKLILDITNDPSKIIFANPCKMPSHIKYAETNNINLMTFDSIEELNKIKLYHPNAELILRIAVNDSKSVFQFSKKFGCHLKEIYELFIISKALKLNIVGFSFHVGSNCLLPEIYYEAIKDCKIAMDIAKEYKIDISIIDLGGGFSNIMFEEITKEINRGINDFFSNTNIKFIAEPGRLFSENTHTTVLNIINKKITNTQIIYYVNDGVYGSFNCLFFDHTKIKIKTLNQSKNSQKFTSTIYGPTCDSIDMIIENVELPELNVGDYIYVENMGAYTTAAASSFNGMDPPINKYIHL